MNKIFGSTVMIMVLLLPRISLADTLELSDGSLLEGRFVGSSNGIIMFDAGGNIEAFPQNQVVALFFSDGVATAESRVVAPSSNRVQVPAGTRLVIRTMEELNSSRHSAGHRFRGQLEGALVVNGRTVAPRGSYVFGRISQANQSGRLAGSSELTIVFTDIMINDQLLPIMTSGVSAQTSGEGRRTAGRTARAAAIGGLIGGSSGARSGARVGLGASILTGGASINIPRGTLVETTLSAPLSV